MYAYVAGNPISFIDPFGLAKRILFPPNTPERAAASQVPDNPNVYTVYAHGTRDTVSPKPDPNTTINAKQLWDIIKSDPNYMAGMPIQLMSCDAGDGNSSIAKQLSDLAKVSVSGYNGDIIYIPQTPFSSAVVSPWPWASNNTFP